MNPLSCVTHDITQLTDQIYRVRIQAESGDLFDFKGGQYLFLHMPDGNRVPLSIASAPEERQFIELHIRLLNDGGLVRQMLDLFQSSAAFQIEGPAGRCCLRESERDVVCIAGGTGFSPMKSMLESALKRGDQRQLSLYLGVQKPEELYQHLLVEDLDRQHHNFHFIPVVGDTSCEWDGEFGFPHQVAVNQLGENAKTCDFYIGGSEAMVVNVYQALKAEGVPAENIYSDILDIKRDMGETV